MTPKLLIVGISGVTCGGKSTLAAEIRKIVPSCEIISQDDYFFDNNDPRHTWIEELNHVNYDILSSLDMEKMFDDVTAVVNSHDEVKLRVDDVKDFISEKLPELVNIKLKETNTRILILEGFCIFNYEPLCKLCSLRYYFTLNKDDCYKRRCKRVYEPPDCPGYFDKCVWPEYLNLYEYTRINVTDVVYFDGTLPPPVEKVLTDIFNMLQSSTNL